MKYVDEYREGDAARRIAAEIRHEADPKRIYRFMEFCGGHTHVLARWGLTDILPPNVRMIHGPGCPVCVLPVARIDMAMQLALERNVILCTYADTMRVPAGKGMSLFKAKAQGADIRMIYSPMDALELAKANPEREVVVFFAIGFETTTPPTAVVLKAAKAAGVKNFSVFCNHARRDDPHPEDERGASRSARSRRSRGPRPRLNHHRFGTLRGLRARQPPSRRCDGVRAPRHALRHPDDGEAGERRPPRS